MCDQTGFLMEPLKQADGNQGYFRDMLMLDGRSEYSYKCTNAFEYSNQLEMKKIKFS